MKIWGDSWNWLFFLWRCFFGAFVISCWKDCYLWISLQVGIRSLYVMLCIWTSGWSLRLLGRSRILHSYIFGLAKILFSLKRGGWWYGTFFRAKARGKTKHWKLIASQSANHNQYLRVIMKPFFVKSGEWYDTECWFTVHQPIHPFIYLHIGNSTPPPSSTTSVIDLGNPHITPAEPVSLRTIFWQVAQSWTFSCSKPGFFWWFWWKEHPNNIWPKQKIKHVFLSCVLIVCFFSKDLYMIRDLWIQCLMRLLYV